MKLLAACLISLALLPACASKTNYLVNRGADIADILRLHGMVGKGVAVQGEVTRLLGLGGTWEEGVKAFGLHNREIGSWTESVRSWGLIVGYHDERETIGIPYYSGSYGWNFEAGGTTLILDETNPLDVLTLRATLMLFIGLDVELRVGEVLDFVAGIFQFDPANDDIDVTQMNLEGA